ncbi:MAG: hypothetical protein KY461_04030 [Actinobacteria bacterium]|nr:hypothetical protein [Actinomycetota bacterium]
MAAAAGARDPSSTTEDAASAEDDVRALIALAALGGPDRLAHSERLALGRALEASPALRAELRALAAVAAALPPPGPRPEPRSLTPLGIPAVLLRPDVVAALAALVLFLGFVRVATAGAAGAAGEVVPVEATTVAGSVEVRDEPWGTELHVTLDDTEPGAGYAVVVDRAAGEPIVVGGFAGAVGTVRYVGTAGVPRDDVRRVRVLDDAGEVVLQADLA